MTPELSLDQIIETARWEEEKECSRQRGDHMQRGDIYRERSVYDWCMLLYRGDQHNTVKQLSSSFKKLVNLKKILEESEHRRSLGQ